MFPGVTAKSTPISAYVADEGRERDMRTCQKDVGWMLEHEGHHKSAQVLPDKKLFDFLGLLQNSHLSPNSFLNV